jgi:hypothetical protein
VGDGRGGRQPQRWVVQGGSASGLPTEFDERVYVALMALTRAQGFAERRVSFSVYSVLRTMGEATDARHYRSVERSLERLLRVSIVAEGAFWDATRKELVRLVNGFHLIERYWLAYREGDPAVVAREGVAGYVVWGEEIWRSFQSGYLKRLDLGRFYGLRTPVARRLYRFLDKKMHKTRRFEIDLFQLAAQLGMTRYRYPAKVREKLQPGIDELLADGYLQGAELVRVGAYTRIRFTRGEGRRVRSPTDEPPRLTRPAGPATDEARLWREAMAAAHGVSAEHRALWEGVLEGVRGRVSPVTYGAWLARTLLVALTPAGARVLTPNAYVRTRLAREHEATLRAALGAALGREVTLAFEAPAA